MSSAGRNQNFSDENLRKVLILNSTENVRKKEASNKENVYSRNTVRTGAVKKPTLQVPNKYPCGCNKNKCCTTSTRQPLIDVRGKNVDRNRHVPEEFIKADFISGNLKLSRHNLPIIPKSKLSSTVIEPNLRLYNNIAEAPCSTKNSITKERSKSIDVTSKREVKSTEFWMSFLAISKTQKDIPYMKVQKFAISRQTIYRVSQKPYSDINDSIPSLRKKTLKKQLSQHSGYFGIVTLDPSANKVNPKVIYSYEYMDQIIYNTIVKHESDIIKPEFLNKNITFVDARACVINWLVKLLQYFQSNTEIFYMTVRLFDKILALLDIPQNKFQLVALAAYWIIEKFMNSATCITGQKLLKLCNNAYSLKCLLEMEKNILMIVQFNISVGDPLIFVYYFIYNMQLYESNMIAFCANYLLEIMTLDFNCNAFDLSLQAASAVFLSLKFFNVKEEIWEKVKDGCGYHDKYEMFDLQKLIIKNLLLVYDEQCPYKESFLKYASEKYGKVSLIIPKFLEKCYTEQDIHQLTLT